MGSPVARRQADYVKMKGAVGQPVTQKARQRPPKRACDSTGWPEGARAMHVERVYHFFCFKFFNFSARILLRGTITNSLKCMYFSYVHVHIVCMCLCVCVCVVCDCVYENTKYLIIHFH